MPGKKAMPLPFVQARQRQAPRIRKTRSTPVPQTGAAPVQVSCNTGTGMCRNLLIVPSLHTRTLRQLPGLAIAATLFRLCLLPERFQFIERKGAPLAPTSRDTGFHRCEPAAELGIRRAHRIFRL